MRASAGLLAVFLVERLPVIGPGLTVERAELLHLVRIVAQAGDCASRKPGRQANGTA